MEEEELPLQRTKGSLSQGKIIKGTIYDADLKISTSSIPHKLENVISRSQTISAFGSGVNRFTLANPERDSPGPGAYVTLARANRSPSVAKSGYGSLQNKTTRSTTNKMISVPGPGAYKAPKNQELRATRFSKFQPIHPLWKQAIVHAKEPAPTAYEQKLSASRSDIYTSIFKSQVKRNQLYLSDAPSASTYRPQVNTFDGRSFSIKKPRNLVKKENIFNSYFGEDKEELGPGSYNPETSRPKIAFTIKEASTDRFGSLKEQYRKRKGIVPNPGPGTYQPPRLANSTNKLRSMFLSQSDRKVFEGKGGPLCYTHEPLKNEFHTNPQHKWV